MLTIKKILFHKHDKAIAYPPHKVLSIPEILVLIFSFLRQHSLKHSIRYVSKLWLSIARPLIRFHDIWEHNHKSDNINNNLEVLNRLHEITDLRIKFSGYFSYISTIDGWNPLVQKTDQLRNEGKLLISRLSLDSPDYFAGMIYPFLATLDTLTEITMHRVQESKIRLIPIFAYCPMLKSLEIDNIYPSCQIVEESSEDCAKFIDFTISGLRRLSIRGMVIERESLNAIIMRCPDLRTLRLLDIAQRSIDTTSFYRQTFYPFVIDQCPQLQEFHFSMAHELCTREIATVMINNIAPQVESSPTLLPSSNSQNQTFLRNTTANGLNINTVSILETDIRLDTSSIYFSPFLHSHYSNIITSLHIIPSSESVTPRYPIYVEEVLHEFLCSAPSLLILNAQSVTYKGEYFNDYYDSEATEAEGNHATRTPILEGDSTVVHNEAPRRTWACRNLQKLRIKLTPAYDDKPHIKNSRITFGYISKMCPDLRELAIEQPKLSFKLNGGFCLLSRLKKLERLIIKTPDITSLKMRDIEWMTLPPPPPPRAKNEKKSRFKTFFDSRPCKSFFSWKDNILANLLRGSRGSSRDPMTDVGGCLKQLARDTDDGFGCWPNLEYLGIFIALEHKGKVIPSCRIAFGMVAKVRPDLEISCSEDDWLKLSKNDAVFLRR